jgi:hypothetical protein
VGTILHWAGHIILDKKKKKFGDGCLLSCAVYSGVSLPMFHRCLLP